MAAGATAVVDDQLLATGPSPAAAQRRRLGDPGIRQAYTAEGQYSISSVGVFPDGTFGRTCRPAPTSSQFYVRYSFYQWNGGKLTYDSAAPIQVTAGSTIPLTETVLPTGSIAGRLTNADGTPAAGVSVFAERPDYATASLASRTTDADGRYRMDDAVTGDWMSGSSGPRWMRNTRTAPSTASPPRTSR